MLQEVMLLNEVETVMVYVSRSMYLEAVSLP